MKVTKLTALNFKGIAAMTQEFEPVTVLFGKNGAGKTSFLDAMRHGLTGCISDPLKKDETVGNVSMVIDLGPEGSPDLHEITRRFGPKSEIKLNGKATSARSILELLSASAGSACTPEAVRATASGSLFDSLRKGTLAKDLIALGLVPSEADAESVVRKARLPLDAETELLKLLPAMPAKFGIGAVNAAYKEAFAERSATNKLLKEMKAKAVFTGPAPVRSMESVDREMALLGAAQEREKLRKRQMLQWQAAVETRERSLQRLKSLEDQFKSMKVVPEPDPARKTSMDGIRSRLTNRLAANARTEGVLSGNIDLLTKALEGLSGNTCPLSDIIVCTADRTGAKAELEAVLKNSQAELERLRIEDSDVKAKLKACDDALMKYDEELKCFIRYREIFAQYKAEKESIPPMPEKPAIDTSAVASDPDAMDRLRAERAAIFAWKGAQEAKKKADMLEKKSAVYSLLVDVLSPKGSVYASAIMVMSGALEDWLNERLDRIRPGWQVKVDPLAGISLKSNAPGAEAIEASQCSSGEQALLLYLASSLADSLSGTGILIMDDLDKLDRQSFSALLDVVTDPAVNTFGTVLLAAVNHEDLVDEAKERAGRVKVIEL